MFALLTRYSLVGVINTLVGYAVIFGCLLAGFSGVMANIAGYAIGLLCSFVLNRHYVFGARGAVSGGEIVKFAIAFAAAYGTNLTVLMAAQSVLGDGHPLAQIPAIVSYSLIFFIVSHTFVFRRSSKA